MKPSANATDGAVDAADKGATDGAVDAADKGATDGAVDAASEVVALCRDLIRIDTTNTGQPETTVGERLAADYVVAKLAEVGLGAEAVETAPGRVSVVARIAGADRDRGALLLHGHLDVVPADPSEWRFDPFSAEVADGCIWGRGAVDMKDFCAMMLAVARQWRRQGTVPPRDIVLAFLADEEVGGGWGAHYLVEHRPDLFAGCTEAIGEVGGFSCAIGGDRRLYLVESAQKGIDWLRLHAKGRPGHGSMVHPDNAVTALAAAVARLGTHDFPTVLTPTVRTFLERAGAATGIELDLEHPETFVAQLGAIADMVGATLRNTANPTRLTAGYKDNVIPGRASATIDCRTLPGQQEHFDEQLRQIVGPDVEIEVITRQPPIETSFDGPLVEAICAALTAEDPGAIAVPYMLSAGTDAKAFVKLGMRCFGFVPLRLPDDFVFGAMFHGIDERVPIDGLQFGVRVLDRLLATC